MIPRAGGPGGRGGGWPTATSGGGGERESPKERIERLVREGKITREAVSEAERLWQERLRLGVRMPNGETVAVALDDVHHVIVDPRIWRKPWRIERILEGVFEIRSTGEGRQLAGSRWDEAGMLLVGYAILEHESKLVTLHVSSTNRLARMLRQGELLWKS